MKQFIILNEPNSNTNTTLLKLPTPNKHRGFIVLPLVEHSQPSIQCKLPTSPHQPNRHPTHLLKHFPSRPHYYLPDTVGAQVGYCLSPLPPCTRDSTQWKLTTATNKNISNPLSKTLPPICLLSSNSEPSSSASASSPSSSSSSFPCLSTFSSPHTSSSSLSLLTQTIESKTTITSACSITKNHASSTSPSPPSPTNDEVNRTQLITMTKKVLPTPPSLSLRVRQVFMNKINSQQAASCAQLPRRKKKIALDPIT